eukprot:1925109-Rhodomonas_salina.1
MQIADFLWYERALTAAEVANAFSGANTYAEDVYALAGLNCISLACKEVFDICPACDESNHSAACTCDRGYFESGP